VLGSSPAGADVEIVSDDKSASTGPFKYHLELTPPQLKITHTALHSLLDDFGHEESDVHRVIREVLDKLPDSHAMRAIRLDEELERQLESSEESPPTPDPDDGGTPPSAA
jgi:hypothetical protein